MIRIMIVDDDDVTPIIEEVRKDAGAEYDSIHVNPTTILESAGGGQVVDTLLTNIASHAETFLDVVAIDMSLGDLGMPGGEDLHLALKICEAVRERNHSARIILYSGTLSEYLKASFGGGDRDGLLRRIFCAEIANFVPRSRIAREICSAFGNPSWLLRLDRMLMMHADKLVLPEEAEFRGRKFGDLAKAVRCQNQDGQKIAGLVSEYGVSCLVDLNS